MAIYILTNRDFLNQKVKFIKTIRSAFNIGLKEAKEIADEFSAGYNIPDDELHLEVRDLPNLIHNYSDFMEILSNQDEIISSNNQNPSLSLGDTSRELREVAKRAIDKSEYDTAIAILSTIKNN